MKTIRPRKKTITNIIIIIISNIIAKKNSPAQPSHESVSRQNRQTNKQTDRQTNDHVYIKKTEEPPKHLESISNLYYSKGKMQSHKKQLSNMTKFTIFTITNGLSSKNLYLFHERTRKAEQTIFALYFVDQTPKGQRSHNTIYLHFKTTQ